MGAGLKGGERMDKAQKDRRAYYAAYYTTHKEERAADKAARNAAYYAAHKKERAAYNAAYRAARKEKIDPANKEE